MYTGYFGLTEAPFAISPNPRYLYMSDLHREALAHLLYGLRSDGCMILLTGDVGTGKTTLCRCLLEQLPDDTEVAVVLNPRLTARELLKTVCEEFGLLGESDTGSIKTYIDAINGYLLRAHANDRTVAIIIDEAQNLAVDVLEQLRLLTNLETPTKKLLRIILLGQPELRDMLARPELAQVNQRITSRYHLGPLQPDDVRNYIQHRLQVAGDTSATLFSEKAIRHAIALTGGIPRLINILCDRALLGAYAVNGEQVNLEIMKRAGTEVFPNLRPKNRKAARAILFGVVCTVLLALPVLVFIPDWLERSPSPTVKQTNEPKRSETAPEDSAEKEQQATEQSPQNAATVTAPGKTAAKAPENLSELNNAPPVPKRVTPAPEANTDTALPLIGENTEFAAEPAPPAEQPAAAADEPATTVVIEEHLPPAGAPPDKTPLPAAETKTPATTIKVSAPLLVLEKAGPTPQKTAQELIAR